MVQDPAATEELEETARASKTAKREAFIALNQDDTAAHVNQKIDSLAIPRHKPSASMPPPLLRPLWLVLVPALLGAADQSPDLKRSELNFIREAISASIPVIKKQALDLMALEQQAVASRQYDAAQQARSRRQNLELELLRLDKQLEWLVARESTLQSRGLPERIDLPLQAAKLEGPSLVAGELGGWSKPGASATWKLPNLPAGGYEVLARFRCGTLEGGTLDIKEEQFHLKASINASSIGPQEQLLGTLKITNGAGKLQVVAGSVLKDNLFNLIALALIPSTQKPPQLGQQKPTPPSETQSSKP